MTKEEAKKFLNKELEAAYERKAKVGLQEDTTYITVLKVALDVLKESNDDIDAISREEVKELISTTPGNFYYFDTIWEGIEKMPGVKLNRPRGHWIPRAEGYFSCSECKAGNEYADNFCPQCGVQMRDIK